MADTQLDEWIRARSYAIWESEGRPEGHESEYWKRAAAEIEEQLRAAFEGECTDFVPPRLRISQRPVRHDDYRPHNRAA